jgi:hypothetical protein
MTTTGPSERHWTTYCFDEHFFADEPRLEGEDEDKDEQGEEEEEEDDDEEPSANIDPILTGPELNVNSWLFSCGFGDTARKDFWISLRCP